MPTPGLKDRFLHAPWSTTGPLAARRMSVLVVDDLADGADTLVALLNLYGHDARAAYSGADALAAAAADPPDVVLLDLRLGDMHGCDVAGRLRAESGGKRPLLVALTGCTAAADRDRTLDVMDLYLVKPVEPTVLLGVLERFRRVLAADDPTSPLWGGLSLPGAGLAVRLPPAPVDSPERPAVRALDG